MLNLVETGYTEIKQLNKIKKKITRSIYNVDISTYGVVQFRNRAIGPVRNLLIGDRVQYETIKS